MSTRGCIALRRMDGDWRGYYHHSDSYPTWLGRKLWARLRQAPPALFRCDERSLFHWLECDPGIDKTIEITSDNPDPLFIEWVYVIDRERRTVTVLTSQHKDNPASKFSNHLVPVKREDGFWDYGTSAYRLVPVCEFPIDGPEPDWESIEEVGHVIGSALENPFRRR
jgi:hypothetical protein